MIAVSHKVSVFGFWSCLDLGCLWLPSKHQRLETGGNWLVAPTFRCFNSPLSKAGWEAPVVFFGAWLENDLDMSTSDYHIGPLRSDLYYSCFRLSQRCLQLPIHNRWSPKWSREYLVVFFLFCRFKTYFSLYIILNKKHIYIYIFILLSTTYFFYVLNRSQVFVLTIKLLWPSMSQWIG